MVRLFFFLSLSHVLFRIFEEAPYHQNHDDPDRERANDADALDIVHAALREDQRYGKNDQKDAPQKNDQRVRFLVLVQPFITVACCGIRNGIERRRIERNHAQQDQNQNER